MGTWENRGKLISRSVEPASCACMRLLEESAHTFEARHPMNVFCQCRRRPVRQYGPPQPYFVDDRRRVEKGMQFFGNLYSNSKA